MLDGRPITSRAGAMGLMQLMPGTWIEMRTVLGLGTDPFDPRDNILAGTCYLGRMYDRFNYPGMSPPIMPGRTATPPGAPGGGACRRRPGPTSWPSPMAGARRRWCPSRVTPSCSWRLRRRNSE
ncbi:lytic transglycosylase domain-containing protein [Sphingomonas sp. JC676]|uniref:lytic transglycosylase domain-containing protein n=1 Tax=Sphingomonas sp. JC676 TaxID=2768065 RepID=UPI0039779C04